MRLDVQVTRGAKLHLPLRQPFAIRHCLGKTGDDLAPIASQSGVLNPID